MNKIIIEVGSTVTKIDKYDGNNLTRIDNILIDFKKNYKLHNKLNENDIEKLINTVNHYKKNTQDVYICGTSIFRNLNPLEQTTFLDYFKNKTGLKFDIISPQEENELTVYGATRFVKDKVCVMIGGGGSTEISIFDGKIIESTNSPIGVIDVTDKFQDLALDIAKTNIEVIKKYIKNHLNLPQNNADILILAGGEHETFARLSGINYEENSLYADPASPIMMDLNTRTKDTKRYFEKISLDKIRSQVKNPEWWYATRAMTAFTLVIAEAIKAKYIIPTNIAMSYGIIMTKLNSQD